MRGFGRISGGTARTIVLGLSRLRAREQPSAIRERQRTFLLGGQEVAAIAVPSADVWSARRSTGVQDVTFYLAVPRPLRLAARAAALALPLAPALRIPALRELTIRALSGGKAGPDAEERARGRVHLYAEATDERGGFVAARLRTPDGYAFTAASAVEIARRVLAGEAPAGFHTPSSAFGPDLALALPDVVREDA
jgi:short subunit dehydrogenase-like uncharacterized protein